MQRRGSLPNMSAEAKFVIRGQRNPTGPFTFSQMRTLYEKGALTRDSECWRDEWKAWIPVSSVLRQETTSASGTLSLASTTPSNQAPALEGRGAALEKAIVPMECQPNIRQTNGFGSVLLGHLNDPSFGLLYIRQRFATILRIPVLPLHFYVL